MDELERLLAQAGGEAGTLVATRLTDVERGLFRISGYQHIIDRVGVRTDLIDLDNYEAFNRIFPVRWRATPDGLRFVRERNQWKAAWSAVTKPGPARCSSCTSKATRSGPTRVLS